MKKLLIVLLFIVAAGVTSFLISDESLPEGRPGPDAEALAEKMLNAINVEAWKQIPFISWSFRDAHHYVWDKRNHIALVKWEDYEVVVDLNTIKGKASRGGDELDDEELDKAIEDAWAFFCNDSFWLNAPAKAFDGGTTRKIIKDDDGNDQLLIQYESGGVTPGDAYLWQLDENYRPVSYKMWVSIIPLGGLKATWSDWKEFDGAMLSTSHKLGPLDIPVGDIKTGKSLEEFGLESSLFVISE
ncbi:MAG: hypothetical protein AAGC47_09020 [Bacteroidota bacterium]